MRAAAARRRSVPVPGSSTTPRTPGSRSNRSASRSKSSRLSDPPAMSTQGPGMVSRGGQGGVWNGGRGVVEHPHRPDRAQEFLALRHAGEGYNRAIHRCRRDTELACRQRRRRQIGAVVSPAQDGVPPTRRRRLRRRADHATTGAGREPIAPAPIQPVATAQSSVRCAHSNSALAAAYASIEA